MDCGICDIILSDELVGLIRIEMILVAIIIDPVFV